MKLLILSVALLLNTTLYCQDWSNKNRVLPDDLRKVPVALYIQHNPNPNYPEMADKSEEYKYVWKHATTVISPDKDLKVIKAGSFIWYSEEGWQKNVGYNRKEFAQKFNCPDGILKAGENYTFEKNYRFGNNLYGGDALWYILAEDEDGNIFKGMALIETETELKQ